MKKRTVTTEMIKGYTEAYLDTCFAMRPGFALFAEAVERHFVEAGRRIIVLPEVLLELCRLVGSEDQKTAECANLALHIIRLHPDLFESPGCLIGETTEENAFADRELLKKLWANRSFGNLLLLTNDRCLGRDARKFNGFESCRGGYVTACYITPNGELRECDDDTGGEYEEDDAVPACPAHDNHVDSGEPQSETSLTEPLSGGNNGIGVVCGFSGGLLVGTLIYKYRRVIVNGVRNIIKI